MQAGGLDMGALLQSAQAMQAEMARAQTSLGDARATGSAGGGLVRAEVDGNGQLVGLTIDPSVVDPDDVDTLADLVIAAVRDGDIIALDVEAGWAGWGCSDCWDCRTSGAFRVWQGWPARSMGSRRPIRLTRPIRPIRKADVPRCMKAPSKM